MNQVTTIYLRKAWNPKYIIS